MSSQSQDGEKKRFIFNRGTLKKAFIISAASVLLFSPAAPIFQNGQFLGFQDQTASAAGLAEVSILGSSTLVSNTGTPTSNGTILSPNLDGNYDVDLTFEGQALANVGLADPKVVVFSLPPELEGKVVGGATIDIDAKLLPITPGDLPAVSVLIGAVDTALNTLKAAATPLGVDLTSLTTAFGAIRNAQDLGSYQASLPGVVSADGKSISVDFTDGLGLFVRQAFVDTFQPLRDAVNQLSFPFPASITLNPLLAALKLALNPVFNLVDTLVEDSSGLLTNFLSVNLLAGTSYDVKFAVSKPDAAQATIHAAAVKNPIIDASLLGAINSEGANATLIFANPIWDNYVIPAPSVNQVYVGDAAITGTVALTNPIPPGSTFEAIVTLADGSTVTAPVNAVDGSFSIDVSGKTLTANDVISTIIQGTNSGVPKDSLSTETTVLAVPNPEWDAYVVKEPTISPVHVGDTNVTGTVTLNTPIPAGTTFTAVVTLPDGSKVNAPVGVDGVITVPLNGYLLQAGDTLSTIIQATNNGATKDSTPTVSTVLPEVNTEWENYVVTPPVISDVTVGDTIVTGTVSLATPIPAGTTFEAIVTLPNGSQVTAPVGIDGVITVPLNGYVLAADDVLNTIIQATNAGETKDSTNVATTVKAVTWGTYTVAAPSLQPIFTTATAIDGTVTLATPIPLGATFEAIQDFYQRFYQLDFAKNQIRATVGALHGMYLTLQTILDPGDEVIIHEPYFSPYKDQVIHSGGVPVLVPTYEKDGFMLDVTLLEAAITSRTKALILNSPNNPTGAVFSPETFKKIAELAKKYDFFILSDEVYDGFSFYAPFVPMATYAPDHTVTFGSLSKNFAMTGWRIGYMVAPSYLNNAAKLLNEGITYSAPTPSQRAAIYALNHAEELIPKVSTVFKERLEYIEKRVAEIEYLSLHPVKGSMYAFINIQKSGLDSLEFSQYVLKETSVLVIPGLAFGESGKDYVRLAATQNLMVLKEAFDRLAKLRFN